ncbi:MAG: gamma-glutamyl-gamma-aminobutyrate hydrolase family protein, partial [Oscillospiraceae bacterium]|nr:gamma-glutamyl-gamma-aminobutyrate hydrolase family protein [Oscillospiraceae bacterium]
YGCPKPHTATHTATAAISTCLTKEKSKLKVESATIGKVVNMGITDANSGEFNELCKNKVIDFMPGQSDRIDKGGTLRLGAYPCEIKPGTTMERCYKTNLITERHRHRYEVNNDYRQGLVSAGLTLSGLSPDDRLVETVELSDKDFFVGVQYHPEFKSRPNKPHPLFNGFIAASLGGKQ